MSMNIDTIKTALKKVVPSELYRPEQVADMGLILNLEFKAPKHKRLYVYRILRNGELPSLDISTSSKPRYVVKGEDLIKYIKNKYKI